MNTDNEKSIVDQQEKLMHHYWDQGLDKYHYFNSLSIEWLRNTANQLALVNSLGATVSVALAAGLQAPILLMPGVTFFVGSILTLFGTFFAHKENEKCAEEMKDRLTQLSDKSKTCIAAAYEYAKNDVRSKVTNGNAYYELAKKLAWGSFACIAIGAILLLPILICEIK